MDPSAIKPLIEEFVQMATRLDMAKADYKVAKEALLQLVPHDIGEHHLDGGSIQAKITYPPKTVWDSEELAALYGTSPPPYVKMTLAVDKKVINTLAQEERDALLKAMNEKPGTPVIEVS